MIPVSVKNFEGYFDKIALSVTRSMHSERENADLQPLSKDRRALSAPQDQPFSNRMVKSTMRMSHLEDKRMTHSHLRKNRGGYFQG